MNKIIARAVLVIFLNLKIVLGALFFRSSSPSRHGRVGGYL